MDFPVAGFNGMNIVVMYTMPVRSILGVMGGVDTSTVMGAAAACAAMVALFCLPFGLDISFSPTQLIWFTALI